MNHARLKEYFFTGVLAVSIGLTLLVFRSYLVPLALGGVLAVVSMPLHRLLYRFVNNRVAAALITVILICILIILPSIYFFAALASEVGNLFQSVSSFFDYNRISEYIRDILPPALQSQVPNIMEQAAQVASSTIKSVSSGLLKFFSNLAAFSLDFLVMMFSTYYLLKDGHKIKGELLRLSPLNDDRDEQVFRNVVTTIRAVVVGMLFIGLLKGVLSGLGYWIAGVPAPFFWGVMTGLAFFIPIVGSGLVMIPAIIYLAVGGQWVAAIGLGVFAVLVVGAIDNFIQPQFIGGRAKIHPLLILLALLGGLEFFGFVGLILGPVVLAVSLALIQIYKADYGNNHQPVPAEEPPESLPPELPFEPPPSELPLETAASEAEEAESAGSGPEEVESEEARPEDDAKV